MDWFLYDRELCHERFKNSCYFKISCYYNFNDFQTSHVFKHHPDELKHHPDEFKPHPDEKLLLKC